MLATGALAALVSWWLLGALAATELPTPHG
jgi:hypothetical protein